MLLKVKVRVKFNFVTLFIPFKFFMHDLPKSNPLIPAYTCRILIKLVDDLDKVDNSPRGNLF